MDIFQSDSEVHIELADQQKINKFARLNNRLEFIKEENKARKNEMQTLEDASTDLMMIEVRILAKTAFQRALKWCISPFLGRRRESSVSDRRGVRLPEPGRGAGRDRREEGDPRGGDQGPVWPDLVPFSMSIYDQDYQI